MYFHQADWSKYVLLQARLGRAPAQPLRQLRDVKFHTAGPVQAPQLVFLLAALGSRRSCVGTAWWLHEAIWGQRAGAAWERRVAVLGQLGGGVQRCEGSVWRAWGLPGAAWPAWGRRWTLWERLGTQWEHCWGGVRAVWCGGCAGQR